MEDNDTYETAEEVLGIRVDEEGRIMGKIASPCPIPARAILGVMRGIMMQLMPIAMEEEQAIRTEKGGIIPATEADLKKLTKPR